MNNNKQIKCTSCGEVIDLEEAIVHELEEKLEKRYAKKHQAEVELRAKEAVEQAEQKLKQKHQVAEKQLRAQAEVIAELKEQKKESAAQTRLQLAKKKTRLEKEATQKAEKQYAMQLRDKEKTITDMNKKLAEAQSKATQGSQKAQGDVQEMLLEDLLKQEFPHDLISRTKSGQRGADILQTVRTNKGTRLGKIYWESKRTKGWHNKWLAKVKDDCRTHDADIGVIVSQTLPAGAPEISIIEGVYVVSVALAPTLAELLRTILGRVAEAKAFASATDEDARRLLDFLQSSAFRSQIEAIIDVFLDMQGDLTKEKSDADRRFAKRNVQLNNMLGAITGLYGSFQGVSGKALPDLKILDTELAG